MKTKISPLDLQAEFREVQHELAERTRRVFESGHYILGREVDKFEEHFRRFVGTKYAIGVASGSDALLLALMALEIKPEDEVLTTPFTFISTATVIARLGAKPVFVDIDPRTLNLNPDLIKKKVTRRTRAIIPVHLYGNPCQVDEILSLAKRFKLSVIEDCAQACGATFRGKQVGNLGDFGAFSFYPTKTIGAAGDAGAITTNQKKLYEKVKSLHRHGEDGRFHSYRHPFIGINSRLDEIQAAVLNVKLKHLAKWNQLRRLAAKRYDRLIFESGSNLKLKLPVETQKGQSVCHQYVIQTPDRDRLLAYLHAAGIQAGVYYPLPLHLQPCFRYLGYRQGDFPVAEQASREVLSLPLYPQIQPVQQQFVISKIRKFFSKNSP